MTEISDLKAKAYDLIAAQETIQLQLRQINQQIIQLENKKNKED
jgi:hypothetical protein